MLLGFGVAGNLFRDAGMFSMAVVCNLRGGGKISPDAETGRVSRRFLRGPFWSASTSPNFPVGKGTVGGTTSEAI